MGLSRRRSRPGQGLPAGAVLVAVVAVVAGSALARLGRRAVRPAATARVVPVVHPEPAVLPGPSAGRPSRRWSGGIAATVVIVLIAAVVVAPAVATDSGDLGDTLALTPPAISTIRPAPALSVRPGPAVADVDLSNTPSDIADPTVAPVTPELDLSSSPTAAPSTAGVPTSVDIPAIGVHASIAPLGLGADGVIQVPDHFDQAGWYSGGPRPGDAGPAVLLGHVDSRTGPAVFFRLKELQPGDTVMVTSSTGTESFIVDSVAKYPKTEFPTEAVYGPVSGRALRLVTCGGTFDNAQRSYLSNVIVFATPAD